MSYFWRNLSNPTRAVKPWAKDTTGRAFGVSGYVDTTSLSIYRSEQDLLEGRRPSVTYTFSHSSARHLGELLLGAKLAGRRGHWGAK